MATENEINVKISATTDQLQEGMQRASRSVGQATAYMRESLGGLGEMVERIKVPFAELLAIVAGTELFKDAIENTAEYAETLELLSQKTGIAVETLSQLRYAADLTHVGQETLETGLKRLARAMQDAATNSGTAARAFEAMGISVTAADGRMRPLDAVLMDVAQRFSQYQDGAAKAALAMDLFGRSGADLIPLLDRGRDGIRQLQEEADKLGVTMSTESVEDAERYEVAVKRLHEALSGLERTLGLILMPALTKFAELLTAVAAATMDLMHAVGMFSVAIVDMMTLSFRQAGNAFSKTLDYMKDAWNRFKSVVNLPGLPAGPGAGGGLPAPIIAKDDGKSAQEQAIRAAEAHQLALLKIDRENANLEEKLGLTTAEERLAQEQEFAQRQYDIKKAALTQLLKLYDDDPKKRAEINRQLAALADEQALDVTKANNKATLEIAKQWDDAMKKVNDAFTKSLDAWTRGTMSASTAIQAMFASLLREFIGYKAKEIETHLAGEAAKKAATAETALVWVGNEAVKAAASTWAALAGIPYVGPFLAPAAAAGALAAVLALSGTIRSAAGGYDIPSGINPVTQLHAQEMVLPAPLANVIRGMAANGGAVAGGGMTVHVHAMDARGVRQFVMDNRDAFADAVSRAAKDGRPL